MKKRIKVIGTFLFLLILVFVFSIYGPKNNNLTGFSTNDFGQVDIAEDEAYSVGIERTWVDSSNAYVSYFINEHQGIDREIRVDYNLLQDNIVIYGGNQEIISSGYQESHYILKIPFYKEEGNYFVGLEFSDGKKNLYLEKELSLENSFITGFAISEGQKTKISKFFLFLFFIMVVIFIVKIRLHKKRISTLGQNVYSRYIMLNRK